MSQKPPDQPRARLFFALDPPRWIRDELVAWQRSQVTDPGLRPVAPEGLHCTLCFLGSRPESEIESVAHALSADLAEPVELTFEPKPVAIPAHRPRLFALGAKSDAAVRVQGRLAAVLEKLMRYESQERAFWPHFTVARVRSEGGHKRRPRHVAVTPGALPDALLSPFHAVRIALYRSYLRSSGSHYVSLASLELPQPA